MDDDICADSEFGRDRTSIGMLEIYDDALLVAIEGRKGWTWIRSLGRYVAVGID